MKISAVQLRSVAGDIEANLAKHLEMIDRIAENRVDLVFFPELSLTGYEPRLAAELAMEEGDARLDVFQERSERHRLAIGVGLPLRGAERRSPDRREAGVRIGLVFFTPGRERQVYAKQHLHEDELPYFVPGDEQLLLHIGGRTIAPAICYESLLPEHAAEAASRGADLYLASVAKPERSLEKAMRHYPQIARRHGMHIVMANSVGPCDDFQSAGRSAAWNRRGERLAQLDAESESCLSVDLEHNP